MERATLKRDSLGFAAGEKGHGLLVHERHVPQIENHKLSGRLDSEQLPELLNIFGLYPATDCEYHLTVY
jgi:hypothetical protein